MVQNNAVSQKEVPWNNVRNVSIDGSVIQRNEFGIGGDSKHAHKCCKWLDQGSFFAKHYVKNDL